MRWIKANWGWATMIIIALIPLIKIAGMINIDFSGQASTWFSMDSFTMPARQPGGMPKEVSGAHLAVKQTGEWAIRWLVAVLSLTPFSILTGIKPSLHARQAAGISAFVYAGLHFLFFCIDRNLIETFTQVSYVLGLIATLAMLALAITSNKLSMRYLRDKWKKLHRLAYLAAILSILHIVLLKHGDWIPYAVILSIGFVVRPTKIKVSIINFRNRNRQNAN